MAATVAGSTKSFGYQDESQLAKPVNSSAPRNRRSSASGRQLNSTESFSIGGSAQAIMGRVANFAKGATSSRPGSGAMPGMNSIPGMGGAADAAGAGEAAAGAEGIGELLPLAAP